jgi:endonuclease YncB( thermonuclease family)
MRGDCPFMRFLIALLVALSLTPAWSADLVVKDGNTIQLSGTTYRLDGVDSPAIDQICLNEFADPYACGADARVQLTKLIGDHPVHCDDLGPDKTFSKWHVGICTAEGADTSLNRLMVQKGFALAAEQGLKANFRPDEDNAKKELQGLWKGCFVTGTNFRHNNKTSVLLGGSCRGDKDRETRAILFPSETVAPPDCTVKGKFAVRAHVTGNLGIYHLPVCRSYETVTRTDRWFCSEEDAQAEGFRKAYNCRPRKK